MKKIFILTAVIACIASGVSINAQEPDLTAIAKTRDIKSDSLSTMLGNVYGTQTAMKHKTAAERQQVLKGMAETINNDQQDEFFKDGSNIANEFFKVSQEMKNRTGIEMNRKAFSDAFLTRFADTTTVNMQTEVQKINLEAKRLIDELTILHKDSTIDLSKSSLINLKSDSLSRNMGSFYGMQVGAINRKKNSTNEQMARLVEGFNGAINIDDSDKALLDGKILGNEFENIQSHFKKQGGININKDLFIGAVTSILNDSKVPTEEEFNAINMQTANYARETQTYVKENGPEALAQKGLGKKYIENLMEKDPAYLQTPSGLVYKIVKAGNGNKFTADNKIKVMYKGTHIDGNTFDESKEPVTFSPKQVVPGFREALLMMSPGAKMIAVLPQNLAYGARGAGQNIKPFETLIFEIETIGLDENDDKKVVKAAAKNTTEAKKATSTKKATATKNKKATSKKAKRKK